MTDLLISAALLAAETGPRPRLRYGETDPLLALQGRARHIPGRGDRDLHHAEGERNWAEADLFGEAGDRFDVPVRQMEVGGS